MHLFRMRKFNKYVGSPYCWDFTQRRMVVPYRRFGTTCESRLQGLRSWSSLLGLLGLLDLWRWTDKLSRNVAKELPFYAVWNPKRAHILVYIHKYIKVKVKQSHYKPVQALRVPGGWGSQISRQSAHEGDKVVSLTHRPPLPHTKYSWYSFLLEAESTPGS